MSDIRYRASDRIQEIIAKSEAGELTRDDLLYIFNVEPYSLDWYTLRWAEDDLTRRMSGGIAEVYGQVGIDALPCPMDCKFCSFAVSNNHRTGELKMPLDEIIDYARKYQEQNANVITIMITVDYDFGEYLEIMAALREALGPDMPLMANMGDFTPKMARQLKDVGVGSVYHAVRVGEGIDTKIHVEARFETIQAAHEAGLKVSTSLESIGPEYSDERIADLMMRLLDLKPEQGGCGGRVNVKNTRGEDVPGHKPGRMAMYGAAFRLYAGKNMRFGCGTYGWAEVGTNPRDHSSHTEKDGLIKMTCGYVPQMRERFRANGFTVDEAPSAFWR